MKKPFLILAMMLGIVSSMHAQTKLGLSLNHIVQTQKVGSVVVPGNAAKAGVQKLQSEENVTTTTPQTVSVIAQLKDGSGLPETSLQNLGITVGFHEGSFAVLEVPVSSIASLDGLTEFVSFEENKILKLDNNRSQEATKVSVVHDATKAVAAGLPQAYTGKGVVVGVFDSGIDFNHNNFRNPITKETRIKKALVFAGESESESPSIYTAAADIDKLTTDDTSASHGTHTTSTIAGSYTGSYVNKSGTVTYTGIQGAAPDADLVLAGTPVLYDSHLMTSLTQMDKTASALNEPLVVNLSLGGHDWNDGKTAECQFFDEFTNKGNKPGRVVCISAGNEADSKSYIHAELNSSNSHTVKTFISATTSGSYQYFVPYVCVYGKDGTQFTVQLEFYNSSYSLQSTEKSSTLVSNGYLSYGTYTNHDGRYAATLYVGKTAYRYASSKYYCAVTVTSESDCEIELYGMDAVGNNYDLTDNGQSGFTSGSTDMSINTMCCTNSVLSVGAWNSQNSFTNYNGQNASYSSYTIGDYTKFSSYTTADDNGIQRPDFAAPGLCLVSGFNSYDTNNWAGLTNKSSSVCGVASEEYLSGHTSICGAMSGTSMSCPSTTGIVALWLQKNPNLTVNQIREIVKKTADNDTYTAAAPERFGAGKINALAGIQDFNEEKIVYNEKYDMDGDGKLDVTDVTRLVNYILGK